MNSFFISISSDAVFIGYDDVVDDSYNDNICCYLVCEVNALIMWNYSLTSFTKPIGS